MPVGLFRNIARISAGHSLRLMKLALSGLVVMASAFAPSVAFASTQSGVIGGINYLGGRVLFTVSGSRADRPTCDCCNRWEILVNDPAGQALLAILLEAYRGGRTVTISGTGSCQAEANDTEGVNSLQTL